MKACVPIVVKGYDENMKRIEDDVQRLQQIDNDIKKFQFVKQTEAMQALSIDKVNDQENVEELKFEKQEESAIQNEPSQLRNMDRVKDKVEEVKFEKQQEQVVQNEATVQKIVYKVKENIEALNSEKQQEPIKQDKPTRPRHMHKDNDDITELPASQEEKSNQDSVVNTVNHVPEELAIVHQDANFNKISAVKTLRQGSGELDAVQQLNPIRVRDLDSNHQPVLDGAQSPVASRLNRVFSTSASPRKSRHDLGPSTWRKRFNKTSRVRNGSPFLTRPLRSYKSLIGNRLSAANNSIDSAQ